MSVVIHKDREREERQRVERGETEKQRERERVREKRDKEEGGMRDVSKKTERTSSLRRANMSTLKPAC